ncbi:EamA/RhaT family transporter [Putridiphycobacter roseus]|uniref:EamA/RhaT family transporter n=2 Tax=Putridiphycobacter roseus TaxID=2219161 RepID=A0A2W1ND56_9FLAO|nr:EamA/RhaT family transporter [Putridiphycobacter roseus]
MLLSSMCFAIVNLFVKLLTNANGLFENFQKFPPYEIVLFRSIISLSICIYIIRRKNIPFFGNNKKWLIIRGIFGATALTMFFYTLQNLPIAIATTVQYLSPLFTILFAIPLQGEKVKPIQWLFFLLSLSGVFIIGLTKSTGSIAFNPLWLLLGLISAVFSGVAYNAIMKCKTTDAPITVVMYFPLIATPVMLVLCIFNGFTMPRGIEWLVILIIGIFTQFAQVLMTKAFHHEKAAKVTPIKYIGAIYAIGIGFFVFNETLSLAVFLGIAFILIGVLLNSFLKFKWSEIRQN